MIVKIQRAIAGEPSTLVYNKDKSLLSVLDGSLGKKVLGAEKKGYFEADIVNEVLQVGKRVKDRKW